MPFFSIIIPTLNEANYLPLLLGDLRCQSLKDFEVITVDGSSADKTFEKVSFFKRRIHDLSVFSVNKRNVSYQRNFGASKAKGEWIIFMDADNRIPNNFTERLKAKLDRISENIYFTTRIDIDTSNLANFLLSIYINFGLFFYPRIGFPWCIGALIGIRRSDFSKITGFKEKAVPAEDTEFAEDAVKRGFKYIIFSDIRYKFSFRRIDKLGFFKAVSNYLWLEVATRRKKKFEVIEKYPMGGSY